MLAHERQQAILQIMQESRSIRITEISERFGVSNETARRDLEYMQKKKLLRRIHGGAILEATNTPMPVNTISPGEFSDASASHESLARIAAGFVSDNDILFVGQGETMHQFSRYLHRFTNLTVLTNSLFVINELVGSKVALYALGGLIDPDEQNMGGSIPVSVIEKFYASKAFMSCGGVSLNGAVSDYNSDGTLLNMMMTHSEKRYLVASSNKFGRNAFGKVCDLQDFDVVITDDALPDEYREYIKHLDVALQITHK